MVSTCPWEQHPASRRQRRCRTCRVRQLRQRQRIRPRRHPQSAERRAKHREQHHTLVRTARKNGTVAAQQGSRSPELVAPGRRRACGTLRQQRRWHPQPRHQPSSAARRERHRQLELQDHHRWYRFECVYLAGVSGGSGSHRLEFGQHRPTSNLPRPQPRDSRRVENSGQMRVPSKTNQLAARSSLCSLNATSA